MSKSIKAIVVINSPQCKGTINIVEWGNGVRFDVNLTDLTPGKHGFLFMKQGIWKMVVKVVVLTLIL